ncbi:MAG: TonB-dependent receptor [Novosphingobium sp.]
MNRPISKVAASVLAIAAMQAAGTAYAADEAANAAAAAADAPADATSSAAEDTSGLTDIVVTATKRETNLQKTPIAISVLGNEDIKKRHVQSLYDLADGAVPSLRVATFEARQSALTIGIRGIVPLDANQPAREQGVGIYIDGVYLGRQHGLNAGLFDVERIEVLKGPQGTLFGRNTEGGALSIVSRAPTGEFGGRLTGGMGNYGAYNMEAHVNLPEFAGFSVKLDGAIQHQDATTKNPLAGQAGWNQYHRQGLRVAVRWQPTSNITNDFSYDVAKDENTPFYSQLLNYNPNNCPLSGTNSVSAAPACAALPGTAFTSISGTVRSLLPGVVVNGTSRMDVADIGVIQQVSVDKTHGFTNVLKWKVAPELELRSITAWRGVTATQWDNSGGLHRPPIVNYTAACTAAAPCLASRYSLANLYQSQFSQELQAVGTIGNIDYVAGLYYFNEHVSDDAATPSSVGVVYVSPTEANYIVLDQCTGSSGFGSLPGCRSIDRASEVWSKSYAAFGQVTWHATDKLHITVGGRYTHDTKYGVLHYSRNVNYDLPANAAFVANTGYKPLDKSWSRFNPMATIAYDFSDTVHGYVKYATGYRAGGASSRTSDYRAFDPEDVKSYEVGLKADFFDRRARFNLAAYMMDRKNSQVDLSTIQFSNGSAFNNLLTFNAPGTTKIRGIEADLTVKPTDNLTLGVSYAYTYTDIPEVSVRYDEVVGGVLTGNFTVVPQKFYIVFTPRNAVSGSIDYSMPIGGAGAEVRLHLDANYSQATQAFDQFATLNDPSFIVNGRLSLADVQMSDHGQKMTISAWVRNMFDKQYVFRRDPSNSLAAVNTAAILVGNTGGILGDYGNFNAPRTFGLEASISF